MKKQTLYSVRDKIIYWKNRRADLRDQLAIANKRIEALEKLLKAR